MKSHNLYESIIKDVSKIIKKHLNEQEDNITLLEDEIILLANEENIDYIDLDGYYLTATINYNEYDDGGRQVDDYPITVDVKSATIDDNEIILTCETEEDNDYSVYFDGDVYLSDILDSRETYKILETIKSLI